MHEGDADAAMQPLEFGLQDLLQLDVERAESGSSSSSSLGREIIERASATRCCSPPDSWRGKRARYSGFRCMRSAISRTLRAISSAVARAQLQRKADILRDRHVRETAPASGTPCWSAARTAGTSAMSWPSIAIRPLSGLSKPAICFSSVVLPQPDGPTSATNSPRSTLRLTPFSACAAPYCFLHIDDVEDRVLPHAPCSVPRCERTIVTTLSPVIPRLEPGSTQSPANCSSSPRSRLGDGKVKRCDDAECHSRYRASYCAAASSSDQIASISSMLGAMRCIWLVVVGVPHVVHLQDVSSPRRCIALSTALLVTTLEVVSSSDRMCPAFLGDHVLEQLLARARAGRFPSGSRSPRPR